MIKKLSFSYSKMGMYQECPKKYEFRYVHMLLEKPKYYFAFGTSLHAAMEYLYNPLNKDFPTLKQILDFFREYWNKTSYIEKGYASLEKEQAGFEEANHILKAYYDKYSAVFHHPLSVEMKSTLDTDGLSLISILDRIDYLGDGRVKILDYKTGKAVPETNDQLLMYQKVAENSPVILSLVQKVDPGIKEIKVAEMSFYHLPKLTEVSRPRADDMEMAGFWQKVLGVADNIRAGKFEARPEKKKCRWCDYCDKCPEGQQCLNMWHAEVCEEAPAGTCLGTPVAAAVSVPPFQTDDEILSKKIDRLGEVEQEEKKLRGEILALMSKQGYRRYFGEHFRADLNVDENFDFEDKQKTIVLLRSLGLLSKTLVPTCRTITALLSDPSVSEEAKAKIRALGRLNKVAQVHITEAE